MKGYLTTVLLYGTIVLIASGIHTNSLILACIGGVLAGVYNAMIYKEK